jgi:hypothetical protein
MKEVCVPLPNLTDEQAADVEVRIGKAKDTFRFRVESFNWVREDMDTGNNILVSVRRIGSLRRELAGYDKGWEVVQIFTPAPGSRYIQVLFRKRTTSRIAGH